MTFSAEDVDVGTHWHIIVPGGAHQWVTITDVRPSPVPGEPDWYMGHDEFSDCDWAFEFGCIVEPWEGP